MKNMCRTVTRDTTFLGTQLHEGEKVLLLFESANFDETAFERPEVFDAARSPNAHLAFGFDLISASATSWPESRDG